MRKAAIVLLAAVLASCSGGDELPTGTAARTPAGDVRYLVEQIEQIHPDPWRNVPEANFRRAAERLQGRFATLSRDEQLVELMRLIALLGERNGHTGIYALDDHRRPLSAYPVYVYEFSDGVFVVATADRDDLLGAELLAIDGTPVEDVLEALGEIVPRDNSSSQRLHASLTLPVAEVLHGLGIVADPPAALFRFRMPHGEVADVELEPLTKSAYLDGLSDEFPTYVYGLPARDDILSLRNLDENWHLEALEGGRALHLAYNHTMGDPTDVSERLLRLARGDRVERVIVDVRQNGGGDNTTYWSLVYNLAEPAIDRPGRLYCLIGRSTFSAAGNFIVDLDKETDVVFVGEPAGGAPNQYGDVIPVTLPATGWIASIAGDYVEKSDPDDPDVTIEPDVSVEWSSDDFFAGQDPVLKAALAR